MRFVMKIVVFLEYFNRNVVRLEARKAPLCG
jgi:hypothetical protein